MPDPSLPEQRGVSVTNRSTGASAPSGASRGTEVATRGAARGPGPAPSGPQEQRAKKLRALEFAQKLKAAEDPREKQLDLLEQEFRRKERDLPSVVAGAKARTLVTSHRDRLNAGKPYGIGFGNEWLDAQVPGELKKRRLKDTPQNRMAVRADLKKEWESKDLREMSCLSMMTIPLDEYVKTAGILNGNLGTESRKLAAATAHARDARGPGKKKGAGEVFEARGTVLLEELRSQFGFETVHIDGLKPGTKYWNEANRTSDNATRKSRTVPNGPAVVVGADTREEIDARVKVERFIKLEGTRRAMSPESRRLWDSLQKLEYAVGVTDSGYHTFVVSNGAVQEVHWDRGPDNPRLTESKPLNRYFALFGGDWGSAVIAAPPNALPRNK